MLHLFFSFFAFQEERNFPFGTHSMLHNGLSVVVALNFGWVLSYAFGLFCFIWAHIKWTIEWKVFGEFSPRPSNEICHNKKKPYINGFKNFLAIDNRKSYSARIIHKHIRQLRERGAERERQSPVFTRCPPPRVRIVAFARIFFSSWQQTFLFFSPRSLSQCGYSKLGIYPMRFPVDLFCVAVLIVCVCTITQNDEIQSAKTIGK